MGDGLGSSGDADAELDGGEYRGDGVAEFA